MSSNIIIFEADEVNGLFVSNIEICEKITEQTTNLAKPPEKSESTNPKSDEAPPDEKRYPKTWRVICVTLGVMAAVLVVAMAWTTTLYVRDNNHSQSILRTFDKCLILLTATAIARLATDFKSISLTGW